MKTISLALLFVLLSIGTKGQEPAKEHFNLNLILGGTYNFYNDILSTNIGLSYYSSAKPYSIELLGGIGKPFFAKNFLLNPSTCAPAVVTDRKYSGSLTGYYRVMKKNELAISSGAGIGIEAYMFKYFYDNGAYGQRGNLYSATLSFRVKWQWLLIEPQYRVIVRGGRNNKNQISLSLLYRFSPKIAE